MSILDYKKANKTIIGAHMLNNYEESSKSKNFMSLTETQNSIDALE